MDKKKDGSICWWQGKELKALFSFPITFLFSYFFSASTLTFFTFHTPPVNFSF